MKQQRKGVRSAKVKPAIEKNIEPGTEEHPQNSLSSKS
jgi:hypothetical protein